MKFYDLFKNSLCISMIALLAGTNLYGYGVIAKLSTQVQDLEINQQSLIINRGHHA